MNNQNLILDYRDITTESGIPDEPVTLQEMKDYMRLEGFVDSDESTTESISNFPYDDSFITNLIIAARRKAEWFCGISIVFHTWEAYIKNGAGDIEFPFQPMRTFLYLTDQYGSAVTSYKLRGFAFKTLESPKCDNHIARYDAGYEDCPEEIVLAIKQTVAYWYDHRAMGSIPELALATLRPFKRAWTWLS